MLLLMAHSSAHYEPLLRKVSKIQAQSAQSVKSHVSNSKRWTKGETRRVCPRSPAVVPLSRRLRFFANRLRQGNKVRRVRCQNDGIGRTEIREYGVPQIPALLWG